MSSITEGLSDLIERLVETDRRLARRAGQHIDTTKKILEDANPKKTTTPPKSLPASSAGDFKGMTDTDLKKLLKAYGVKGYTQREGKKLQRKDRVQLAIENKIPALSFGFLLDYYINHSSN